MTLVLSTDSSQILSAATLFIYLLIY